MDEMMKLTWQNMLDTNVGRAQHLYEAGDAGGAVAALEDAAKAAEKLGDDDRKRELLQSARDAGGRAR